MKLSIITTTMTVLLILGLALLITICVLIYQNSGERGAAKRAEQDYRYRKYYEIKDEVDEIEKELNKVNAEVDTQYWAHKKAAHKDNYERWKEQRTLEQAKEEKGTRN